MNFYCTGSDYIFSGNPLTISLTAGTSGCIEVIVLNDNISENDDTVTFTAESSDRMEVQITEGGSLNLTIINDDSKCKECMVGVVWK